MTATDSIILLACAAALQDLTAVQTTDCPVDIPYSEDPVLEVIVGPPAPTVPPAVLATLAAHRCGLHSAQSRQSPYSWELHVVPHPPASPHRGTPTVTAIQTGPTNSIENSVNTDDIENTEKTDTTEITEEPDSTDSTEPSNDDRPSQPILLQNTAADAQHPTPMPTNPDPDSHPDADSTPPTGPDLALEIDIARHLETEFSTGALEITHTATDEPTIMLGFGGHWGTTTTELTSTEARHVAHTLLQAADHIDAREHGDPHEDGRKQAHHRGQSAADIEATEVSGRPEATDASEASDAREPMPDDTNTSTMGPTVEHEQTADPEGDETDG